MKHTGLSLVVSYTGSKDETIHLEFLMRKLDHLEFLYVIIEFIFRCLMEDASMLAHLLHIIIQSYDDQWCWEAGIGWHSSPHWWCLIDVTMVTGLQEVGCLVVFIQNFDLKVSKSWQGVTIVLLCLKGGRERSMLQLWFWDHSCHIFLLLPITHKLVNVPLSFCECDFAVLILIKVPSWLCCLSIGCHTHCCFSIMHSGFKGGP